MPRTEHLYFAFLVSEFHLVNFTFRLEQLAMTDQRSHSSAFQQTSDTQRGGFDNLVLARLHGSNIKLNTIKLNAMQCKFMLRTMIKLGGFKQCLGGNAACIQAGTAE